MVIPVQYEARVIHGSSYKRVYLHTGLHRGPRMDTDIIHGVTKDLASALDESVLSHLGSTLHLLYRK